MRFPKPVMTVNELVEMGFPRKALYRWASMPDFPRITMPGGRKILVKTKEFNDFLAAKETEWDIRKESGR